MPSIQPTPANAYLFAGDTPLDPPTLNLVFGSIHARIAAQEAMVIDYETAIDNLNNLGLQVIADNLSPQLTAARDQLDALQAQANVLEDQVATILAGGVAASNVSVGAIEGLDATNAQAAIAELLAGLAAEVTARTDAIEAVTPVKFTAVSANTALVAGSAYRIRATAITLTLPAAPSNGDTVRLTDGGVLSATATATVARNGKTIMGLAEDLTLDTAGLDVRIWYNGTEWRLAL